MENNATNGSVLLQTIMFIMNQSSFQDANFNYYYLDVGKGTNVTKCYGMYGCFQLNDPWTSEHRPVSYFPGDLEMIEPSYLFYTRNNPKRYKRLDLNEEDIVQSSGMDPSKSIYVISHGFLENGQIEWIQEMTQELLSYEDCSVIVVDWRNGSSPPYTQAVANIRLIGTMTAHLIADIVSHSDNLKLDRVHCIGHSLGAHLCGYVGYTLKKEFGLTLGRISGLDPAEPHFGKLGPPVRLDKTAAKYVDVVHTDASQILIRGLGIYERIGHVDYYPNGGSNQPGCNLRTYHQYIAQENSVFQGIRKFLGCNHIRSYEFFMESINPKCSFLSMSCDSYEAFLEGKCFNCGKFGENCIRFGFHSNKHYKKLIDKGAIEDNQSLVQYFMTGEKRPYCRAHYKITVKISDSERSKLHRGEVGELVFTMHTTSDGKGFKSKPAAMTGGYHEPGKTYTGVIATDEVSRLKAVEVEWRYTTSPFNPLTYRLFAAARIFIDNIVIESLELQNRLTVCPKMDTPLISGTPQIYIPAYCGNSKV